MSDDQDQWKNNTFQTSIRGKLPPLVTTDCKLQDDGRSFRTIPAYFCIPV